MRSPPSESLLRAGLAAGADRPAFITPSGVTTYGALAQQIEHVASLLGRDGLGAGHRLAVVAKPRVESFAVLLGALDRGMVVSVLSSALGDSARALRLDAFQPQRVVSEVEDLERRDAPFAGAPPWDCEPGLVMWTSGTSGSPKGAYLSMDAVRWNVASNAATLGLRGDDRTLLVLDPAYCYGLIHQILSHLSVGAAVVIPARSPWIGRVDAEIERHACTTLPVVPSLLQTLLPVSHQLHRLRVMTIGGAPSPESLLAAAHERMPRTAIYVTYGLTEAGPRVCTRLWAPGESRPGNVGRPFPGVSLSVRPDGELVLDTPSRSTGHVGGGRLEVCGGPIATGDLAEIEEDGTVRILGRRSRAINRGGLKISPEELERVLCTDATVRAACVVGIPDRRFGEVPMAYVQPATTDAAPDPVRLVSLCRREVGHAWVPKRIVIVDALPEIARGWKEVRR